MLDLMVRREKRLKRGGEERGREVRKIDRSGCSVQI